MFNRNHMFNKVTIVGVGLIGGSLGLAIKKKELAREVVGLAHKHSSLVNGLKIQAIDTALTEIPRAIQNADLVILAAPVKAIVATIPAINQYLKRGGIVTDVGSTKVEIIDAVNKHFSQPTFFVGSHPLAGSEKQGATFARADLFEGSTCIMTPVESTNQVAKEKVKLFWSKLGSTVKFMSPEEHDESLAYVSHLPHLLAYGLVETIPPQHLELAAQGFKDTTRIASSSVQMWSDICLSNNTKLIKSLDAFAKNLAILRKALHNKDQKTLTDFFAKAKEKRDGLNPKQE